MNSIAIMGRLTSTPTLKTTASGLSVTSFTIAVPRRYSGEEKQTDFIDCVAWRKTAEFIERYFCKGDMIAVVGELQTRTYDDKNGNRRKAVEVIINNVSFCGGKSEHSSQANIEFEEIDDDDLPFN